MVYWNRYRTSTGGRSRAIKTQRDYKKDISRLEKIGNLTLGDLKKIEKFLKEYPGKCQKIAEQNALIKAKNIAAKENHEAQERAEHSTINQQREETHAKHIQPLEAEIARLKRALEPYRVSALGGLMRSGSITSNVLGHKMSFKREALHIVRNIERYMESIAEIRRHMPPLVHTRPPAPEKLLKDPREYSVLTIGGTKCRVFYKDFELAEVESLIEQRKQDKDNEAQKIQQIKARAYRNESEVRNQAKPLRRKLSAQLKIMHNCPYCLGPLDANNAHQDHIHPVAKGGLSTSDNLVFVCSDCNLKKRDKVLISFLLEQGLDFEQVTARLNALGKL